MRRKALRRSAASTKEWQRRSAQNGSLRRTELARQGKGGANPPRPAESSVAEGPLMPLEWRREVWRLDAGRCVMCGVSVPRDADRWWWQAHHPVEKQNVPPGVRWDPRNGVTTCRRCHERHTSWTARIPGDRLPERARAFARELGPSFVALLERNHPPAGSCGNREEQHV